MSLQPFPVPEKGAQRQSELPDADCVQGRVETSADTAKCCAESTSFAVTDGITSAI